MRRSDPKNIFFLPLRLEASTKSPQKVIKVGSAQDLHKEIFLKVRTTPYLSDHINTTHTGNRFCFCVKHTLTRFFFFLWFCGFQISLACTRWKKDLDLYANETETWEWYPELWYTRGSNRSFFSDRTIIDLEFKHFKLFIILFRKS